MHYELTEMFFLYLEEFLVICIFIVAIVAVCRSDTSWLLSAG